MADKVKVDTEFNKIYAIPDIHGDLEKLNVLMGHLLAILTPQEDLVVFLGDYIDRGANSIEVMDRVLSASKELGCQVLALRGNHENFMIDVGSGKEEVIDWIQYGGGLHTLANFGWTGTIKNNGPYERRLTREEELRSIVNSDRFQYYCKKLQDLPIAIETKDFLFSHAPVPREKKRDNPGTEYTEKELTFNYFGYESERVQGGLYVHEGPKDKFGKGSRDLIGVCGHLHRLQLNNPSIRLFNNYYLLDAGCGCGENGRLALFECYSKEVVYF